MRKVCVAIWDSAVQAYGNPIFAPSRGAMLRTFSDEVNRKAEDNGLYRHPEDYELRILGEFDEETGVFHVPPEGVGSCLIRGKDCVRDA